MSEPFFQHCLPIQKFSYAVKNGLEAVTLSENLTQFTDASDISAWAVSAMQWAVGQGLIQGCLLYTSRCTFSHTVSRSASG